MSEAQPEAEHIRVQDKDTGHQYTIRAELFNDEAHKRIDKPAYGNDGLPAPVKYRTEIGEDTPAKRGRPHDSSKTTQNVTDATPAPDTSGQSAGSGQEN